MGLSWTNSCVSDRPLRPITGGRSNSKMINDQEILVLGLRLALPKTPEARWRKWSLESQHKKFQNKYGSTHTTVLKIWKELHTTTIDAARLFDKEKNPTYFLMSLYYLTKYPIFSDLADMFGVCEKTARTWVWPYIKKIRALSPSKIIWPDRWNRSDTEKLLLSVDGIHFHIREPYHPTKVKDPKNYSHKNKQAGVDYEIGVSLWENKIVWFSGPWPAGKNDISIFKDGGLMDKIPEGKKGIADNGYKGHNGKLALSNSLDTEAVRLLKGRAKARQEQLNSRLRLFDCLDGRFRNRLDKHPIIFEAVLVLVQIQLDNNERPLFDV